MSKKQVTVDDLSCTFLDELFRVKRGHVPPPDIMFDMKTFELVRATKRGLRLTQFGEEVAEAYSPFELRDKLSRKMLNRLEQWRNNADADLRDLRDSMSRLNKRHGLFVDRVFVFVDEVGEEVGEEVIQARLCGVWFQFYKKLEGHSHPFFGWVVGMVRRIPEVPTKPPVPENKTLTYHIPPESQSKKGDICVRMTPEQLEDEVHRSRCRPLSVPAHVTTVTTIAIDRKAARRGE